MTSKAWGELLKAILLWALGIASVIAGILVGIEDHASSSATLLVGGILLLLIANLERLEMIKGLGIEARTRDLDKRIEEAGVTLAALRRMLETTARFTFHVLARLGRWDSHIPRRDAYTIITQLTSQLEDAGVDRAVIAETLEPWHNTVAWDMLAPSVEKARQFVLEKLQSEERRLQSLPVVSATSEEGAERTRCTLAVQGLGATAARLASFMNLKATAMPDAIEAELRTNTVFSDHEKAQLRGLVEQAITTARDYVKTKAIGNVEQWIAQEPAR